MGKLFGEFYNFSHFQIQINVMGFPTLKILIVLKLQYLRHYINTNMLLPRIVKLLFTITMLPPSIYNFFTGPFIQRTLRMLHFW